MIHLSPEKQLRNAVAPTPDPRARVEARRAAVAEFERLHAVQEDSRGPQRRWPGRTGLWSGLIAASVAVIGVSIFLRIPEEQRYPARLAPVTSVVPETRGEGPAASTVETAVEPAPLPATEPELGPARLPATAPATQPSAGEERGVPAAAPVEPATLATVDMPGFRSTLPQALTMNQAPAGVMLASTEPEELGQVIGTGTRIQSSQVMTSANPVVSITAEEMRRLGIVNVSDALATLQPQGNTISQISATNQGNPIDRGSFFVGDTIANLRGLDPAFAGRTLTLVDGRRVVAPAVTPAPSRDRFEHFEINPLKRTASEPVSTFSIDVDTASYSFARRQLNQGVLPPAESIRAEELINYFDYGWPASTSRERPFRPTVTVSDSPWNEGRKLVHIGIKGYEMPAGARPDVNLVLLVDVSGSMNSPDKLPLAQRSMALLLDSLKPTDTVAIAVYAGAAGEVLAPTPVREKEKILTALNSLRAGGSTAGAAGIRLAYELARRNFREGGVNRILLATDGDFNVGISDTSELKRYVERERASGVFLSVLGFGQGNYRDEMAQVLAQNGNGVAAYIDTLNEARKVLVEQAGAALFTIASDVKIQVEFNPATVAEYRLIGYETRALNREDFNNDRVDAGDVGAGHSVTAIYEITPVGASGQLIDDRRYAGESAAPRGRTSEYGFLKIRYKLPGKSESELLEQPIEVRAGVPRALRQDVEFATAVASFAQLLQGGRYAGKLDYEDVFSQAQDSLGSDPYGYRAEFVQLVRRARDIAASTGTPQQ